ncbi:hypothetical protein [Dactylosporangium sp. NPDC050588]|uniref:hypothetical protein n=1 Tax=Dactylosporangium sp. NPDC050588 TaxID=3157211 RepID=UPI0033FE6E3C
MLISSCSCFGRDGSSRRAETVHIDATGSDGVVGDDGGRQVETDRPETATREHRPFDGGGPFPGGPIRRSISVKMQASSRSAVPGSGGRLAEPPARL